MKKLNYLSLIGFVLLLFLSACSKEKRVEHKLTRKGGLWDIEKLNVKVYDEDGFPEDVYGYSNCGNILFKDNGSVTFTITADDSTTITTGTWTNNENIITITTGGVSSKYKIKELTHKELQMTNTVEVDQGGYTYSYVYTFETKLNK